MSPGRSRLPTAVPFWRRAKRERLLREDAAAGGSGSDGVAQHPHVLRAPSSYAGVEFCGEA
jgi:hypothetical protein